jgi:hypothetical protein
MIERHSWTPSSSRRRSVGPDTLTNFEARSRRTRPPPFQSMRRRPDTVLSVTATVLGLMGPVGYLRYWMVTSGVGWPSNRRSRVHDPGGVGGLVDGAPGSPVTYTHRRVATFSAVLWPGRVYYGFTNVGVG